MGNDFLNFFYCLIYDETAIKSYYTVAICNAAVIKSYVQMGIRNKH